MAPTRLPSTQEGVRAFLQSLVDAFDSDPDRCMALIHAVQERLDTSEHMNETEPLTHVAQHLVEIAPDLSKEPTFNGTINWFATPGNMQFTMPIASAGGALLTAGGIAYVLGIYSIYSYCMGTDGTAAPGESVDVHHLGVWC